MLPPPEPDGGRLRSVDAYRGFVMLAMASGGIATFGRLPAREGDIVDSTRGPASAIRPRAMAWRRFLGSDSTVVHVLGRRVDAVFVQPQARPRR